LGETHIMNKMYLNSGRVQIQKKLSRKKEEDGSASVRASASHCQIDCQISFDNYHLNLRDIETRQN
jgi:hypothetical protein